MPLSPDPEARKAQLANLRADAATVHGARSEAKLKPSRERYLTELRDQFPAAGEDELIMQASRLAQMDLLQQFLDWRGVIRDRRRGETFPAAQLLASITAAYERRRDILAERERTKGEQPEDLQAYLQRTYGQDGQP